MKIERIDMWYAIVHFDEVTHLYTVSTTENGGVVITNENLETAKSEFIKSMKLAESLLKLQAFKYSGKFCYVACSEYKRRMGQCECMRNYGCSQTVIN